MKPIASIIGDSRIAPRSRQAQITRQAGASAIACGYRIQTGGLGILPRLVARGARSHPHYREGDVIALLPGFDPAEGYADIIVPTGLDLLRNGLLANANIVIAIGGGAGTLSEIALAWQLNRPILAWTGGGWSAKVAGRPIDHRRKDTVRGFENSIELERLLLHFKRNPLPRHRQIAVRPRSNGPLVGQDPSL